MAKKVKTFEIEVSEGLMKELIEKYGSKEVALLAIIKKYGKKIPHNKAKSRL